MSYPALFGAAFCDALRRSINFKIVHHQTSEFSVGTPAIVRHMLKTLVVLFAAAAALAANDKQSLIFTEDFDGQDDVFAKGKWIKSADAKYRDQPILVKPPTKSVAGYEADKGVQLTQEMKHYGFGARFPTPLRFDRDEVVIQYELKLEERLNCGGAYIKLLRDGAIKLEKLNNESPYTIMFGPDKCGTDSRLHFILKYMNPVSKMWTEHHYDGHIKPKIDRSYLALRKDNTFEVFIDTKSVAQQSPAQPHAPYQPSGRDRRPPGFQAVYLDRPADDVRHQCCEARRLG